MTKVDVFDLNNTMSHSYFGEGNLKDSILSESLMCTVLGASNTNEAGKPDSCFYDGKIQLSDTSEYISMKASRHSRSFNAVMSSTALKLNQLFNMTSGKIEVCDVVTNWQMSTSLGKRDTAVHKSDYLSYLLDNEDYCDKICAIYEYVPSEHDTYSVAASYPGNDGLVYITKTSAVSSKRLFVAAVSIKSMALYSTEFRLSVRTTLAIFGEPTINIGIKLLDPELEAGKFAAIRESVIDKVSRINDIKILKDIEDFIDKVVPR